jgi:hypothetical protein
MARNVNGRFKLDQLNRAKRKRAAAADCNRNRNHCHGLPFVHPV